MTGADAARTADDDVVVLPWWQHPMNIVTMLVTVALVAGMVGWLVGRSSNDVETSDVDVGFLQDMRIHHEQAIDMSFAFLTRPGTNPGLRTVARSIIFEQSVDIGLMLQLLEDMDAPDVNEDGQAMAWMGHAVPAAEMPGMATEDDFERLGDAEGGEADRLFVELMTAHHQGGIDMSEEAAERAENDDVRSYAASWARGQQLEIQGARRPPAGHQRAGHNIGELSVRISVRSAHQNRERSTNPRRDG